MVSSQTFIFLYTYAGNSGIKKKPGPMKANLSMSEVTKSPTLKKEASTPKKSRPLSSTHRVKSQSLTNIRYYFVNPEVVAKD